MCHVILDEKYNTQHEYTLVPMEWTSIRFCTHLAGSSSQNMFPADEVSCFNGFAVVVVVVVVVEFPALAFRGTAFNA